MIDVDARIKNLEALKARVLEPLAKNTGSLKDMLDAEKQLAETQPALDSIHGQRRVRASQTDIIRIDIELRPQSLRMRPQSLRTEGSWAAPVAIAAGEAGLVLMNSVAFLLTAAVALLPRMLVFRLAFFTLRGCGAGGARRSSLRCRQQSDREQRRQVRVNSGDPTFRGFRGNFNFPNCGSHPHLRDALMR